MQSAGAYRALIERLEVQARENPIGYRLRLAALAVLGYAVLGASVAFALAISVGLLLVLVLSKNWVLMAKLGKFALLPLGLAWVILRALWVRIEPPQGYLVRPGEAPELEAEVERLRQLTSAPPLAGIIIDEQLNAAAVTIPRALGLLGNRHYLLLGLPLAQALDEDELRAVIAHEFGHFGRGHSRFAGWIYRLRQSWFRVLDAMEQRQALASGLYSRFFNWYAPYFNAYSFVLARADEYEADAVARKIAGVEAAGSALLRIELGAHRLDADFWPALDRSAAVSATPPHTLYHDMREALAREAPADAQRLQQALARQPGLDDTHPVLSQRLAALGAAATLGPRRARPASQTLLGELGPALEARFSSQWQEWIQERWSERHHAARGQQARLGALRAASGERELAPAETTEYALLADDHDPAGSAEALLRRALQTDAGHPLLNYRLGALLLQRGEAAGESHLRRCIAADPQSTESALRHIAQFHEQRGDRAARDAIADELGALYAARARAEHERREWRPSDPLLPHGLDTPAMAEFIDSLQRCGGVRRVWLARKPIDDDSGLPHHVMIVKLGFATWSQSRALARLSEQACLPGTWLAFPTGSARGALVRRIKKVPGACIDIA